jgi:hypothetical protein
VDALSDAVDSQRVIIRGDGELGSVACMHAIVESGAHLLTRLSRYSLLNRDEVVANMPALQWHAVRPGESRVRREAAELGTFTFRGSDKHADLQVTVRVIVTRFKRSSKPEHGVLRDGYQLELFATTLDSAPWPAPDVAELYSGRAVVENRYAQEDREFGMGRTYCYNPAGQEWMVGVGLYLWNDQVIMGWRSNSPPRMQRTQTNRPDPQIAAPTLDLPRQVDQLPTCAAPASDNIEESSHNEDLLTVEPVTDDSSTAALSSIVQNAFADVLTLAGWDFDSATASLTCPWNKRLFPYSSTGVSAAGAPRLSVRTEPYACQGCPTRTGCFPVDRRSPYKQIARKLAPEVQVQAAALLKKVERQPPKLRRSRSVDKSAGEAPMRPYRESPTSNATPGPWWCETPRFLPAAARAAAREAIRGLTIVIQLRRVRCSRRPLAHPLVARDSDSRAHRRKTLEALAQVRRAHNTSVIVGIKKCAA